MSVFLSPRAQNERNVKKSNFKMIFSGALLLASDSVANLFDDGLLPEHPTNHVTQFQRLE